MPCASGCKCRWSLEKLRYDQIRMQWKITDPLILKYEDTDEVREEIIVLWNA
jgi:hypothetical protein